MNEETKARAHRYQLEAARKLDRAREAYVRALCSTGFFNRKEARERWLDLLRAEVAVEVTAQRQRGFEFWGRPD